MDTEHWQRAVLSLNYEVVLLQRLLNTAEAVSVMYYNLIPKLRRCRWRESERDVITSDT